MRCRNTDLVRKLGFEDGMDLHLNNHNQIIKGVDRRDGELVPEYNGLFVLGFESDGLIRTKHMTQPRYALIGSNPDDCYPHGAKALSYLKFADGVEVYLCGPRLLEADVSTGFKDYYSLGRVDHVDGNADEIVETLLKDTSLLFFTTGTSNEINSGVLPANSARSTDHLLGYDTAVFLGEEGVFSYESKLEASLITTQIPTHQYQQPASRAYSCRRVRFSDT